ncbi:MAG: carboxyl transferase domain-containing protein [Alphaproteobacteria bacterium]|nr:carboxyl transferase domain-containing protein [Alphaproteobacteria bacterium]MDP6518198.1 carboxyl transferase domain-containing protein [Alphaproteobacteria bacterium]
MSWQPEIDELRKREAMALEMGGPEKIERQRKAGRLTVRERIDALLDPGSFHEIGTIAGNATYRPDGSIAEFRASNFVFGRGRIDDRPVVVGGDDFTVRGGAADAGIREKQISSEQMAHELGLPIIRLVEGTGGGGSVKSLEMDGYTYVPANPGWEWVVANMGKVPVVALALGPVAGLGAGRMASSHYALIVKGQAQMFVAGPPVVARLGERVDKETLGGSDIHTRNGAIDDAVESEEEAFARTRRYLSYLPSSIDSLPPRIEPTDPVDRREDWLIDVVPHNRRKIYKMRPVIEAVVDKDSFFEIGRDYGRSLITGLARLDGWPVALLAGDPYFYAGGWTANASIKATRFVDLAETFHLPVVHLVDCPGFLIGRKAEEAATIRHGARALAAIYQATVPWCSVIIRKVFGVAGAGHANAARFHYRYAWPSGDWGSLPLEGGIEAAYKSDLEKAEDPAAMLADIEERLNHVRTPFRTAERFSVEELIDPRDTRPLLCEFANLAAPLRKPGPSRFAMRP